MQTWQRIGLAGFAAAVGVSAQARAADITWGSAALEISTDADIKIAGRNVVYAVNGGDNVGNPSMYASPATPPGPVKNVVIGGQTLAFQGETVQYASASSTFDAVTANPPQVTFGFTSERGTTTPLATFDLDQVKQPRVYPGATGNADLDSVLASQIFSDARNDNSAGSSLTIELHELTPGTEYQIQLIAAADGRVASSGDNLRKDNVYYVLDPSGNRSPDINSMKDLNADGGAHVTSVIGTFIADSANQDMSVLIANGRNPGISGLILTTAAPEPAAIGFLAAGIPLLMRRRRMERDHA